MVRAAGGNQLDAMTTGLDNAAANPLPHHAWRSGEARCQDGVSGFFPWVTDRECRATRYG